MISKTTTPRSTASRAWEFSLVIRLGLADERRPLLLRLPQLHESADIRILDDHRAPIRHLDNPTVRHRGGAARLHLRVNGVDIGHLESHVIGADISELLVRWLFVPVLRGAQQ